MSKRTLFSSLLAREEFTGWHMVGVMALFFGVVISVNITLAVFANTSWTGLVVKNTYVASQQFNEEAERMRLEAEMGWKIFADYRDEGFSVELTDRHGHIIRGAQITAKIGRPVSEYDDRIVQLTQASDELYRANTPLAPGLWDANIAVEDSQGRAWNRLLRFTITEAGEIDSR